MLLLSGCVKIKKCICLCITHAVLYCVDTHSSFCLVLYHKFHYSYILPVMRSVLTRPHMSICFLLLKEEAATRSCATASLRIHILCFCWLGSFFYSFLCFLCVLNNCCLFCCCTFFIDRLCIFIDITSILLNSCHCFHYTVLSS